MCPVTTRLGIGVAFCECIKQVNYSNTNEVCTRFGGAATGGQCPCSPSAEANICAVSSGAMLSALNIKSICCKLNSKFAQ